MKRELTRREKAVLSIGAALSLILLILFGVIEPYRSAMGRLDVRIASRKAQLATLRAMHAEGVRLKRELDTVTKRLDRGGDASLLSTLEGLVTKVARKENLLYMKPQPAGQQGEYRETAVELKIEKVDLAQILRFLSEVEGATTPFVVKRMQISRRYDETRLLDAVMIVSTYRKVS